jgi:hypothetical protein
MCKGFKYSKGFRDGFLYTYSGKDSKRSRQIFGAIQGQIVRIQDRIVRDSRINWKWSRDRLIRSHSTSPTQPYDNNLPLAPDTNVSVNHKLPGLPAV